jgi:hypothetical protein
MLSYIFGVLGEVVAPSVDDAQDELFTYLRARHQVKALQLLRNPVKAKRIDINCLSADTGYAAIHVASACGNIELVNEVLTLGGYINLPADNGNTALHLSSLNGHKTMVNFLMRAGADPSIPNNEGCIAIELASDNEIKSILTKLIPRSITSPVPTLTGKRIVFIIN